MPPYPVRFHCLPLEIVKLVVQQVRLEGLHGSRHDLPSVLGLEESSESSIPGSPEQVLGSFTKRMVELPNCMDVLANDGVRRVRELWMKVEYHIHGPTSLKTKAPGC